METYPRSQTGSHSLHATRNPIRRPSRGCPRMKVSVPVTVFSRGEQSRGKIVDLSSTGAFILMPKLPDLTGQLELYIKIPNMHVVFVLGAIVRFDVRPAGDGSIHHYGLGVRFSNISDEDRVSLACVFKRSVPASTRGAQRVPTPCLMGTSKGNKEEALLQ
jgi:hypothetical protein